LNRGSETRVKAEIPYAESESEGREPGPQILRHGEGNRGKHEDRRRLTDQLDPDEPHHRSKLPKIE
jgi:hypothetical protein